jgi:hypothetical protein
MAVRGLKVQEIRVDQGFPRRRGRIPRFPERPESTLPNPRKLQPLQVSLRQLSKEKPVGISGLVIMRGFKADEHHHIIAFGLDPVLVGKLPLLAADVAGPADYEPEKNASREVQAFRRFRRAIRRLRRGRFRWLSTKCGLFRCPNDTSTDTGSAVCDRPQRLGWQL